MSQQQLSAAAELELRRRREKRRSILFRDWLYEQRPDWDWDTKHIAYIREALYENEQSSSTRLMVMLPPRHGKTELVTTRYAAYRLERDPETRIILGAYNQDLAEYFSRKIRRIVRDRGISLNPERSLVADWETAAGGGVKAAGVGSGVTGRGADLIIIDDPVKSREEAESPAYRERCWDWYANDVYTRLEPGGDIILIQTRWHEDDLAGRILQSETAADWRVIRLPALAEETDPLGRDPGEALWPRRYDEEALEDRRRTLGDRDFESIFQQNPRPRTGGDFKEAWFEYVDPHEVPKALRKVRYWDCASSILKGDYSCGVLMGRAADGTYYVLDVTRGQWSGGTRDRNIRQCAKRDGRMTRIYVEQDPGSSGKDAAAAIVKQLAGYIAKANPVTGPKPVRAIMFASQCEIGNVKIVRGPWNAAYISELCGFPFGRYDDQVDGSSGAFSKLRMPFLAGATASAVSKHAAS